MSNPDNPWVQTFTGKAFDLVAPTLDMVSATDLAYGLSRQIRFNGHARYNITVAQHSVLAALAAAQHHQKGRFVSPNIPLRVAVAWTLLHDAAEAYIGDLATPIRRAMRKALSNDHTDGDSSAFDKIDDNVSQLIWTWAGIEQWTGEHGIQDWKEIKQIDYQMLAFEKKWFVRTKEPQSWGPLPSALTFSDFGLDADDPDDFAVARTLVYSWSEKEAIENFLAAIHYLAKGSALFRNIQDIKVNELFLTSPVQKRFARLMEIYS